MTVKKKEKPAHDRQSENSGGRKSGNSVPSVRSIKTQNGGDADKAKTSKTKASNPTKNEKW